MPVIQRRWCYECRTESRNRRRRVASKRAFTIISVLLYTASFVSCDALILQSGQRIAPLSAPSTSGTVTAPIGLLELPAVEEWATAENLKERHLKTLFRELLRRHNDNDHDDKPSLFQRLLENDFPKSAASSLLLHNDQSKKFVECTSKVVKTSPSQRGCKLAIQYGGDGPIVETVLIRHPPPDGDTSNAVNDADRYTVCVSCQHGCFRACTFCETGTMGLRSNLSSGQILEQVWHAEQYLSNQSAGRVRNIVFMGQGEATDTYETVHEACRGLTHQCLFGLAAKQITISTVGSSPHRIRDLADDMPGVSLALSLHGATQELREELIPSARGVKGTTLDVLSEALDYHAATTGRGVMIEYLLIDGINDGDAAADALGAFCLERQRMQTKGGRNSSVTYVNLIPYNPTNAGDRFDYKTPTDDRIEAFASKLRDVYGVRTLVRWSSADGRDANGACGQLVSSITGARKGGLKGRST